MKGKSIVIIASECQPFFASGGLGDVIGSLPSKVLKEINGKESELVLVLRIEDSEGQVVRTLTVTSFTTKGRGGRRGYTFRPTCVPTWVKNAGAEQMTDEQIDAVTGATPSKSGLQTFIWDFKDADGKAVPAGNYKICLEATLYFNSIVMYSGSFSTKDKAGDIKLTSTLTEEDEAHKDMITQVKAELK